MTRAHGALSARSSRGGHLGALADPCAIGRTVGGGENSPGGAPVREGEDSDRVGLSGHSSPGPGRSGRDRVCCRTVVAERIGKPILLPAPLTVQRTSGFKPRRAFAGLLGTFGLSAVHGDVLGRTRSAVSQAARGSILTGGRRLHGYRPRSLGCYRGGAHARRSFRWASLSSGLQVSDASAGFEPATFLSSVPVSGIDFGCCQ